jgi:hypothetical protein
MPRLRVIGLTLCRPTGADRVKSGSLSGATRAVAWQFHHSGAMPLTYCSPTGSRSSQPPLGACRGSKPSPVGICPSDFPRLAYHAQSGSP